MGTASLALWRREKESNLQDLRPDRLSRPASSPRRLHPPFSLDWQLSLYNETSTGMKVNWSCRRDSNSYWIGSQPIASTNWATTGKRVPWMCGRYGSRAVSTGVPGGIRTHTFADFKFAASTVGLQGQDGAAKKTRTSAIGLMRPNGTSRPLQRYGSRGRS